MAQLIEAFNVQFNWGFAWKFKERWQLLGSNCPYFGLRGTKNVVRTTKWIDSAVAKMKLYSV